MPKKRCGTCKEWKDLECFNKAKNRKYGRDHRCRKCSKKYYKEHREERYQYTTKYNQEHKKENRKYEQEHKEIRKRYRDEHKKEKNKWQRNKYNTDSLYRLNDLIGSAIRKVKNPSIKKGRSWIKLFPYTLIELRKHLKSTLPKGYTWKDFMQGKLHIDHILPKAIFQYEKPEDLDFQICWGLGNLSLLPAKENMSKRSKLIIPFQKCFPIKIKIKK